MKIRTFTVGNFGVNCFLLTDEATGASAIVDTGETDQLVRELQVLTPAPDVQLILLTHAHIDHAGALPLLQAVWDVPTVLGAAEREFYQSLPFQGSAFGMPHLDRPAGRIDRWVDDGDTVQLGQTTLRFLSTPGHTPGQGCWVVDGDVFVGDTLFAGSIGRTDFPGSSPEQMVESLRRLTELPGHTRVHSGHGPVTTIEQELRTNPFLGYIRKERGISGGYDYSWM